MPAPLADRLRPTSLDDVVGQQHLLGKNAPLRNIIEGGRIPNMIFYGPSGTGKTTVASIIASATNMKLHKLNATQASTKDIKDIITEIGSFDAMDGILLYLDEIQYFNKRQQQSLLEHIENGNITLIASATENPYFYVYSAILSRSTVFEFKPVEPDDVTGAVHRAAGVLSEEYGVEIVFKDDADKKISFACGGDVRKAINAVELCAMSAKPSKGKIVITPQNAALLSQRSGMKYDRDGDSHYDILSAYQKSMRGSDPDAAVHYLARLLEAGDLPSACRRLLVCACEDVGLAYPQIIPIVKAAVDTALQVGLPEAQIPLADAVIAVALAPKSNSGATAIGAALKDVQAGNSGNIPDSLKDSHYSGAEKLDHGTGYLYPHNFANGYVEQQYLPDRLKNKKYYVYGNNKNEQAFKSYHDKITGKGE